MRSAFSKASEMEDTASSISTMTPRRIPAEAASPTPIILGDPSSDSCLPTTTRYGGTDIQPDKNMFSCHFYFKFSLTILEIILPSAWPFTFAITFFHDFAEIFGSSAGLGDDLLDHSANFSSLIASGKYFAVPPFVSFPDRLDPVCSRSFELSIESLCCLTFLPITLRVSRQ
jgi:hypothetical protein